MLYKTIHTQAAEGAIKCRFLSWWPWPSNSSERWTTSSLWIWRKSVQWFPRYFIHNKKSQTVPKAEPYAVHCMR